MLPSIESVTYKCTYLDPELIDNNSYLFSS